MIRGALIALASAGMIVAAGCGQSDQQPVASPTATGAAASKNGATSMGAPKPMAIPGGGTLLQPGTKVNGKG